MCNGSESDTELERLNRAVRPYSSQKILALDIGETVQLPNQNGVPKRIQIFSVDEHRDSVVGLARFAEVRISVDGEVLDLRCQPYTMPTDHAGLRLLVDTTSGWGNVDKRVQLSVWPEGNPLVDVSKVGMPVQAMRLFAEGTQGYNEPVHLGAGDGDVAGQRFYHDYGFDWAGYEGKETVVSAVDGVIAVFWPSREDLCSIMVEDSKGTIWEHGHLMSCLPELEVGTPVAKGQEIGVLGRTGPSGNFSHTHLGTFLSRDDLERYRGNRRLNLYPWVAEIAMSQSEAGIMAVARPHWHVKTGETLRLDGRRSLAWGGRQIVRWQWEYPDGRRTDGPETEIRFEEPGSYVVALWVEDNQGNRDVDFCSVKAFTAENPEFHLPHLFLTVFPSHAVRVGQEVAFKVWLQGTGEEDIALDFGDGRRVTGLESYVEVVHRYSEPGLHVVSALGRAGRLPMTTKVKVWVEASQS